jgi:hypothetical protein
MTSPKRKKNKKNSNFQKKQLIAQPRALRYPSVSVETNGVDFKKKLHRNALAKAKNVPQNNRTTLLKIRY